MKILRAEQLKDVDNYTIKNEPISSIKLMERAAWTCTDWIKKNFLEQKFYVFCGMGNNGGDGLAIARQLHDLGRITEIFILKTKIEGSPDFETNKKLAIELGIKTIEITSIEQLPALESNLILIDAILGSGLRGIVSDFLSDVIRTLNRSEAKKIAIDLPSGLFCDDNSNNQNEIIRADYTLSLHLPKLSLLLPEYADFVGHCEILPIGLNDDFIAIQNTDLYYTTSEELQPKLLHRSQHAHKGNFGHALIIAGMKGKMGAAVLAAKSCLRSGVGLLTVHIPNCGYQIMQISVPEAMVDCNPSEEVLTGKVNHTNKVIGVGPGIGTGETTAQFLYNLLLTCEKPLVIDADALNILAENKEWLIAVPKFSILTPHPKEFERLVGPWNSANEKLEKLKAFSAKYHICVVLKGAYTAIASPNGNIYFNSTGNPGMATGGSGDVLTGLITGLLAQSYSPLDAAKIGVYLHGLAGDLAAKKISEESIIASDINDHLGYAFKMLKERH